MSGDEIAVEFVEDLPDHGWSKWRQVRAVLAGQPGQWAKIGARGGYPKQRLMELGCEVRLRDGQLYARFPARARGSHD